MTSASDKRKKVSKNKKKTWRKHIDTEDVDNFLEQTRQEERIGSVADKSDADLFTVDTAKTSEKQQISVKVKRKLKALTAAPRCLSALENTSKVPDPLTNRSKVKPLKNATKLRPQKGKKVEKGAKKVEEKYEFTRDLWAVDGPAVEREKKKAKLETEYLSENLLDYHLKNTGTNIRKVPGTAKQRKTKLRAVSAPDPGISYNPTLADHRNLIEKAIKKEEIIIKKEAHLERVTSQMTKKVPAAEHDKEYLQEMSAGLEINDQEEENEVKIKEENETDIVYKSINPPVQVKIKDRQTRRKQKEQHNLQMERKKEKIDKKKLSDIDRIKAIKNQVVKKEMKLANLKNRDSLVEKKKPYGAVRLGKQKYEDPDEEILMPNELVGSLRTLAPKGSILKDRFHSMQKRNILAPNKSIGVRKRHKVKTYIKNTHKGVLEKPINNYRGKK